MRRLARTCIGLTLMALAACGGGGGGGGGAATPEASRPEPGGPIPGLTTAERAAFERGKLVFKRRFRPSEGLGPFYNATACASCHSTPTMGGSSQLYRNFYVAMLGTPPFQFPINGLPSLVVPAFGTGNHFSTESGRIVIPQASPFLPITVAQRNGIPVFGVGLFEFISDATIMSNADPDDTIVVDGISGRYNTDALGIGRFGVKAQSNNIELFTRAPLNNQMGITTDPLLGSGGVVSLSSARVQASSNPDDPTIDNDAVPDPELSTSDLGDLIAFSRFLAPVGQVRPFSEAAVRGEVLFEGLGCVKCHIPSLPSSRGPVAAYTDLLLHDMGPDLADGLSQGSPQASLTSPPTTENEFRTQPLWGVSLHAPFLHDGRAETLAEAISLHAGEAQAIRDAYVALTADEQADLIEFLEHL
jgi:CxxC motif-containing protein (DUF1111 family)